MKIIVAHPSKQHSFYTATAVKNADALFCYVTSIYDKPGTITYFLKNLLSRKNKNKASTRKNPSLQDSEVKVIYELSGLFLLLVRRIPFLNNKLYNKLFVRRRKKFGRYVAKLAVENDVDAVIMYDSTAVECFHILKEKRPQIKRILDVSICHRKLMRENFEKDMDATHDNSLKEENAILWNDALMNDYIQEVQDSNYFFVPSKIVKRSLIHIGVNEKNIKIIPYGVNLNHFSFNEKRDHIGPLKLIYVGQISFRKGLHHLLKVLSTFNTDKIELTLAGAYNPNNTLYRKYCKFPNIHFAGFVTRDKLAEYYRQSDFFIFPTLGEGYGLVVLESLSSGTPVLVSDLAGGNDIIEDGYNGFVFQAGNDVEMERILTLLVSDKSKLPDYSRNAYESVQDMSWETYYRNVQKTVSKIINEN